MTPRQKRTLAVTGVVLGVAGAVALVLAAFSENIMFFYTPSQVAAGEAPRERPVRVGGLVVTGSVLRETGTLGVRFRITDMQQTMEVAYEGILPDLFREGQGIIAQGRIDGSGRLVASEVLAKHDEKYMPPEVAESLAEQGAGPLAPVRDPAAATP